MKKNIQAVDVPESELMKRYRDAKDAYLDAKETYENVTDMVKQAMLKYARAKRGEMVEVVENVPVMETLGWHKKNMKMFVCNVSVSTALLDRASEKEASFHDNASYCIQYEGVGFNPDGTMSYPHVIDDDRVLELRKIVEIAK